MRAISRSANLLAIFSEVRPQAQSKLSDIRDVLCQNSVSDSAIFFK